MSTSQSPGGGVDKHPGRPEEPTDANPCCNTEKPLHTKDGQAPLQPRAELDQLGLTALRAMVEVELYGSSDLGRNPSDDEPPSMTSASPSEDNKPEDNENPSRRKKKKKWKTKRLRGRRLEEGKAMATSKIVVNLPEFTGKDLSEFAENFGRFIRMTGQTHASGRVTCNPLLQCCKTKYLEKDVKQIMTKSPTFADVLVRLGYAVPDLGNRPLHQG